MQKQHSVGEEVKLFTAEDIQPYGPRPGWDIYGTGPPSPSVFL